MDPFAKKKKKYLISLLKKYGEYDDNVDWENMSPETVDEIYSVLLIKDEDKRKEVIDGYVNRDAKKMHELRNRAENLLRKVRELSIKKNEIISDIEDKADLDNLENKISEMDNW